MKRIVRALAFTACIVLGVLYLARTERVRSWLEGPEPALQTWSQPGVHQGPRSERSDRPEPPSAAPSAVAGVPVGYSARGAN